MLCFSYWRWLLLGLAIIGVGYSGGLMRYSEIPARRRNLIFKDRTRPPDGWLYQPGEGHAYT